MSDPSFQQTKESKQRKQQQDLVDLPEQVPESPWKQLLFSTKFLFLFSVGLFFVGRNFYIQYTKQPMVPGSIQQQRQIKEAQVSPQIFSRFFWYMILTVVFFGLYIWLKRSNDTADEQKIREEVKKQEQEQIKRKIIEEKGKKIITSMDQFGNVVDEQAFKKKQKKEEINESKKDK